MKQLLRAFTVIFGLAVFLFSCDKKFLKPEPLSFFTPENIFINEAGFQAALVTVELDLKTEFYGESNPSTKDISVSEMGSTYTNDWSRVTPTSSGFAFSQMYGYIKNCNVINSRIDDIKWSSETARNAVLGEALFYRSYWYYRLVNSYGDVPWVGSEIQGAKLDFQTYSKWAILKKIQSDLKFAADWLPVNSPRYRPSKYAALQLLSKVYLENLEFDSAIIATTSIINGPFSLMNNRFGSEKDDPSRNYIWDLFRPENISIGENTETIFYLVDRSNAPAGAKSTGTYTLRNYSPGFFYPQVLDAAGKHGTIATYPDGRNSEQYIKLGRGNPTIMPAPWFNYTLWNDGPYFWENTPDLRRGGGNWVDEKDIVYNNPESVDYGKPINISYLKNPGDSLYILFPLGYYKVWYPMPAGFTGRPVGGNGDYYVYRLAETYLIRAEAHFWKGELQLAANDLNKVRERAKATLITQSDVNLDFIFDERVRELFYEEMRHTELTRAALILAQQNKGGYDLSGFTTKNWVYDRVIARSQLFQVNQIGGATFKIFPYTTFWPIPQSVISANTKGVINQNMGYIGAENNVPPIDKIE